jgi:hypothetical protein
MLPVAQIVQLEDAIEDENFPDIPSAMISV